MNTNDTRRYKTSISSLCSPYKNESVCYNGFYEHYESFLINYNLKENWLLLTSNVNLVIKCYIPRCHEQYCTELFEFLILYCNHLWQCEIQKFVNVNLISDVDLIFACMCFLKERCIYNVYIYNSWKGLYVICVHTVHVYIERASVYVYYFPGETKLFLVTMSGWAAYERKHLKRILLLWK